MKALTIRQPWAWAVARGVKLVENRGQSFAHRGALAIHAGKASPGAETLADARVLVAMEPWLSPTERDRQQVDLALHEDPAADDGFAFGAIVAMVNMTGCHPAVGCCAPWGLADYSPGSGRPTHHLVFNDVRRLETPVRCSGMQSLWRVAPDTAALVTAQLSG